MRLAHLASQCAECQQTTHGRTPHRCGNFALSCLSCPGSSPARRSTQSKAAKVRKVQKVRKRFFSVFSDPLLGLEFKAALRRTWFEAQLPLLAAPGMCAASGPSSGAAGLPSVEREKPLVDRTPWLTKALQALPPIWMLSVW